MLLVFVTAGFIAFQSCTKEELLSESYENSALDADLKKADKLRTFYGPTTPVGNGVARAWVKEDANGNPVEVGLNLSSKALQSLPNHHAAFVLPFHKNKGQNFYDHVLLDWAPDGHEPPGTYDIPHFDIHFYTISVEEREAIPGSMDPDVMPAAKYIPENYIMLPGVVPQMGAHWADETAPELPWNGGALFTHTFIYGSYNGKFTFMEPMITRDFLLGLVNQPAVTAPVKQPQAWQKDGWYPTSYKISWSDKPGEYTITLAGLTWRAGE